MQAVDAIYLALHELHRDRFAEPPLRLMGQPDQPQAFCSFTWHEISEAQAFLRRCGLLRPICASGV